jgi:hypothetical protein
MTSSASRLLRSAGLLSLLTLSCFLFNPQPAQGQLWLQTSRLITPVEDGPVRVFVDTLVAVMERKKLKVKRSPEGKQSFTIEELRTELIDEAGIGLSSGVNHAFVDYRFTIDDGSDFRQRVSSIHFVFRPGPGQSDISVMYLDAQQPWVTQLLRNKGTDLPTNEAALIPFHRHLGFARIARQEETQIVEIGGQTVREGFTERKEALIRKVERLTYESYV